MGIAQIYRLSHIYSQRYNWLLAIEVTKIEMTDKVTCIKCDMLFDNYCQDL